MSRDRLDIMMELLELGRDVIDEIKHQLTYYRASVYKHETAQQIGDRVNQLHTVAEIISDDLILDLFRDFEATAGNGNLKAVPGECVFSTRITTLTQGLLEQFTLFESNMRNTTNDNQNKELTRVLEKNKHKLLGMCRHGTRQWAFFHSL